MNYLSWRELRAKLNEETDERVLAEPALFAHTDAFGGETLVPVELIRDTWHPADVPSTLRYNEGSEEYERLGAGEGEDCRSLRKLPPNALLLHYSEMEENTEERTDWLAQPNPFTPAPVAAPTPLFDTAEPDPNKAGNEPTA